MKRGDWITATLATALVLGAAPVHAATDSEAEQLRRLDIMLMVTGLRCRTTAHDFQRDFQAFEAAHMAELNGAAAQLRTRLASRVGAAGANRALDRISTSMANSYGNGHPWLGCAELKSVTRTLAQMRGAGVLAEAADQLLAPTGNGRLALAGR